MAGHLLWSHKVWVKYWFPRGLEQVTQTFQASVSSPVRCRFNELLHMMFSAMPGTPNNYYRSGRFWEFDSQCERKVKNGYYALPLRVSLG